MQRPTLHPSTVFDETLSSAPRKPRLWRRALSLLGRAALRLVTPLPMFRRAREGEEHSPLVRIVRGLTMRLAILPVVTAVVVSTLVYCGTHPVNPIGEDFAPVDLRASRADPSGQGLYFERVQMTASDGVQSSGWLVPVLDASRVLEEKEAVLTTRRPAVVLVHDQTHGPDQMLGLVEELNRLGIVTLTVALRGTGTDRSHGRTFGLTEERDVTAALEILRTRATVDPDNIGVVGVGTGAVAALLAARNIPSLRAVVAVEPPSSSQELVSGLSPRQKCLTFLNPLSIWTFESFYGVNIDDGDLTRLTSALRRRDVLYLMGDTDVSFTSIRRGEAGTAVFYLKSKLLPDETVTKLE